MISVWIQAGGRSERMGYDKALLPFRGQLLILRMIDRLQDLNAAISIVSNNPSMILPDQLRITRDILPDLGPLGGLFTALTCARSPYLAVIACDLPFISSQVLRLQFDRILSTHADVVVPFSRNGEEPMHAVYRREPCLRAVIRAIREGYRRVNAWYPYVKIDRLKWEDVQIVDPDGTTFLNLNTPEDFQNAENLDSLLMG